MVERGQFLERMTVIDAGDRSLEGLYQAGGGGEGDPALVLGGHVALGGTMEGPVPTEICWALCRAGVPSLRFNYRGVGASTGEPAVRALSPDDLADALDGPAALEPFVDDARAALAQLTETHPGRPVTVVGYSFGAWVAARLAGEMEAALVVLVAPPVAVRPGLLRALSVPTDALVICGGADPRGPATEVEAELTGGGALGVVRDADHGFTRGLSELGLRLSSHLGALDR